MKRTIHLNFPGLAVTALLFQAFTAPFPAFSQNKPEPGLLLSIKSRSGVSDVLIASNVALYVSAGKSPAPFLPAETFTARWTGSLNVDLRGQYVFQAELNGSLTIEINGQPALKAENKGKLSEPGQKIRLNKGTNFFVADFIAPEQGDAFVRLLWVPADSFRQPVPNSLFTSSRGNEEFSRAQKLRRGRELFLEHRCVKCHRQENASGVPEFEMDAPALAEIGSRRSPSWMLKWILDPTTERASARMPKVFHGPDARESTEAVAAYLASLKSLTKPAAPVAPTSEQTDAGKKHFETLHCTACHTPPGAPVDPLKMSLQHVPEKFLPGALAPFLLKPHEGYAWIRMPDFKLKQEEAGALAAYLIPTNVSHEESSAPAEKIQRGKSLVQSSGCLNCHSLNLENNFSARPLASIPATGWNSGCLQEKPGDAKTPFFGFKTEAREALQSLAAAGWTALFRHVPMEFAQRQIQNLNCAGCHYQAEGFPPLDILGGKLKPEWMAAFIAGEIKDKPRPWLETRMPAFPKYAQGIAEGLSMSHGWPPQTAAEPAINMEAAKIGPTLVSALGGFSCVSCHSVAGWAATEVFEAPGINFAYSASRLQPAYFHRWLMNPALIDSQTKMPVYFEADGKSPLTEIFEGKADKQIEALWQYMRQGDKMPPPKTAER